MTWHAIDEALLTAAGDAAITVVARRVHLQSPYATTKLFPLTREVRAGYFDPRGWAAGQRAADRAVFTAGRISA
jgi:hypothetical protein